MAITNLTSQDVLLKKDGILVGCSQSASFSVTTDVKETVCQATGAWRAIATGRKSWTSSFQALARKFGTVEEQAANVSFKQLLAELVAGTQVEIEFDVAGESFGGSGYITEISFDKPEDDFVTYSVTIEGNGEFALLP